MSRVDAPAAQALRLAMITTLDCSQDETAQCSFKFQPDLPLHLLPSISLGLLERHPIDISLR